MKKSSYLILSALFPVFLSGCGGGSSSSSDDTNTDADTTSYQSNDDSLEGVAAIGAPLANANILVRGSVGNTVATTTNALGEYSADVSSLTPPFLVRVNDDSNGIELYSYSNDDSGANITPITSVIVSQSMPANLTFRAFFDSFSVIDRALFQTQVEAAITTVNSRFADTGFTSFNHFTQPFVADSTGYDLILDELNIAYDGSSVNIQDDSYTPIITTVDIQAMEENDDATTASVSGRITAGLTDTPITTASITATNTFTGEVFSASSDANGDFALALPRYNVFNLVVEADGYQNTQYLNMSTFSASSQISIALIPVLDLSETAPVTYNASVINATTNSTPIDGANVSIREGQNNLYGTVLQTATTDSSGQLSFVDLIPGAYTLELTKDGFYTRYENIFVDSSIIGLTDALYMLPETNITDINTSADLTIILSWAEDPSDLDSHLTGPIEGSDERFHTSYYGMCWADTALDENSNCTTEYNEVTDEFTYPNATAYLDRDDTSSFGPETTTIQQVIPGVYNFYVHHFSGLGSIATTSNAQVIAIDQYGQQYTFNAPITGGQGNEDIWHVFTTDASGNIIPINTITAEDTDVTETLRSTYGQENIHSLVDSLPEK